MEIIGSCILAIIQSVLFYGKEIGISMLVFVGVANATILYILNRKNKIKNKNGYFLIIPIVLLSSSYFIFANRTFYIANIFALIILNIIMFVILTNKKDYLKNYLYKTFSLITDTIAKHKDGIELTKEKTKEHIKENKNINKENIKKVTSSVLVVFAIVGIVIILLASADSIFASMFSGVENVFKGINIGNAFRIILRLAIIVVTYIVFLSLILNIQKENAREEKELKKGSSKYNFTIKLLLITLKIVYLVFCYIQIKTLFAKINLDGTFNYATYARTGFFQLMFVSFINFTIILVSNKYNENKERIIKILNLLLVVFTIIIVMSSMYRMHMYEMEYGLTYLRTFVYVILLTELAIFVPTIAYIFNEKFDFIKWCFIIVICAYCGVNFANIEKIIIDKNLNRNITTTPIDYDYIYSIASEDSYGVLEEKLKEENINTSEKLEITKILLNISSNSKEMEWQEFNISRWKMKEKNIDEQELKNKKQELEDAIIEERKALEKLSKKPENYVYTEAINENEEYVVEQIDTAMGDALWTIEKFTNKGTKCTTMNTITVTTPSKIKFFENGLGFLERPTSIYCGKSELLVTHDSGKTFNRIDFPSGVFTLSNSNGEKWENCYDYFYLPTKQADGSLIVLASGGYEGGYNQGKTRAKYISKDHGYTWQFVEEIYK